MTSLLRRLVPDCRTVLDVGCGTGEHARLLAEQGFAVDGLDIEPDFVRIASAKNPAGRFVRVSRHSRTEVDGRWSRLLFEYEIEDHGEVRRVSEVHELGLFTTEETTQAFREAGLDVEHDPEGLTGRGLFIARSAGR